MGTPAVLGMFWDIDEGSSRRQTAVNLLGPAPRPTGRCGPQPCSAASMVWADRMPPLQHGVGQFVSDSARASCIVPTIMAKRVRAVPRADPGSFGARRVQISSRFTLAPFV